MGVFKKKGSDKWYYDISWKGRRVQRSTGQTNKARAKEVEAKELDRLTSEYFGLSSAVRSIGFKQAAEEWLEGCEHRRLNEDTLKSYRLYANYWIERFGNQPCRQLPEDSVLSALRDIHKAGKWSPKTMKAYFFGLEQILTPQKAWHRIGEGLKLPDLPETPGICITDEERDNLLRACGESTSPWMYPLIFLFLETGMRKMELIGMRRSQIEEVDSPFGGTVTILTVGKSKTRSGRGRRIDLSPEGAAVLNDWLALFPDAPEDGFIFPGIVATGNPGPSGKAPILGIDWSRPMATGSGQWAKTRKAAGLDNIARKLGDKKGLSFHDLRHTAHTLDRLNPEIDNELVRARYGHKSDSQAARYTHPGDVDRIRAQYARRGIPVPEKTKLRAVK